MQIFWHLLPHFGGMSVGFPCRARRGPSALQGGRGVGVWVVVVVVVCGCVGVGGWVWVCEWCGGGGGGGGQGCCWRRNKGSVPYWSLLLPAAVR